MTSYSCYCANQLNKRILYVFPWSDIAMFTMQFLNLACLLSQRRNEGTPKGLNPHDGVTLLAFRPLDTDHEMEREQHCPTQGETTLKRAVARLRSVISLPKRSRTSPTEPVVLLGVRPLASGEPPRSMLDRASGSDPWSGRRVPRMGLSSLGAQKAKMPLTSSNGARAAKMPRMGISSLRAR